MKEGRKICAGRDVEREKGNDGRDERRRETKEWMQGGVTRRKEGRKEGTRGTSLTVLRSRRTRGMQVMLVE
jgi:hypothetical protein